MRAAQIVAPQKHSVVENEDPDIASARADTTQLHANAPHELTRGLESNPDSGLPWWRADARLRVMSLLRKPLRD